MSLLIKNIGRIYTPLKSLPFSEIKEYDNCSILIEDGKISAIHENNGSRPQADDVIDAGGKTVLPGFIDAHTHPVFWAAREQEFIMRIQGRSYEEIAEAGGGIRNSVRKFRQADKHAVKEVTAKRIAKFPEFGVTTIEAKSGYGLSTADEIKSLEIINELNDEQPLDMVPTFLGAHEVPDEYQDNRRGYIDLLKNEMIPLVSERKLARYCDVFCEKGVFTVEESREILQTALDHDLKLRIHADELSPFGGAELAAELNAATADHLVQASDKGIEQMAEAGVIPVMLPGTTFYLRKEIFAPARKMIDAGCEIALSTDFNPGSSVTQNLQLIWTISALKMGLLPNEMLWAATLIPARSLSLEDSIGSIESGKQADLVILVIPNLNYLAYHYGINHTFMTIKNGQVIYKS